MNSLRATLIRRALHSRRRLLAIGVALTVIALPAAVLASHSFSDVPTSNKFHTAISNIDKAAITAGCGGTRYCPDGLVTRGQMAAFLNRGLGRTALAANSLSLQDSDALYVTGLPLAAGGTSGGVGFVTLTGTVTVGVDEAAICPCEVAVWIDRIAGGEVVDGSAASFLVVTDDASPHSGFRLGTGTATWTFRVSSGKTHEFALGADVLRNNDPSGSSASFVDGTLTAIYSPFGSTGSSTLGGAQGGITGTTNPVVRGAGPSVVKR